MGQDQSHFQENRQIESQLPIQQITEQDLKKVKSDPAQRIRQGLINSRQSRRIINDPNNQTGRYKGQYLQEINQQAWTLMHYDKIQLEKLKSEDGLQGVLQKQSPGFFSTWSKRYCILRNNKFIYRETEDKQSPMAGNINFNLLSCTVHLSHPIRPQFFSLQVDNSNKTFVFRGHNQQTTQIWASQLQKFTINSLGRKYKLTYLSNYHRFWRKDYCSELEFRKSAEIGDILLFRGKKQSAVLQRVVTAQEYDHIGIVLKNQRGQILIFQANGLTGVGICAWRNFINKKWYKDQQIVVLRRLKINRTQKFITQIQSFVARNIGKKYKFSVKNYLVNRQSNPHQNSDQLKKSYFCSSLVASLYKHLGLINQTKSSCQYLPSSFSQKVNLQIFCNGPFGQAYLDQETIIVFQQNFFDKQ